MVIFVLLLVSIPFAFCQYKYTRVLTFNVTEEETFSSFEMLLNTSTLIADGKMLPNCVDLKIFFSGSGSPIQIPYYLEFGCNTTETSIWVDISEIHISEPQTLSLIFYYGSSYDPNDQMRLIYNSSHDYVFAHTGECPEGWEHFDKLDGKFPRLINQGIPDEKSEDSHTHSMTLTITGEDKNEKIVGDYDDYYDKIVPYGHTHRIEGSLMSTSTNPPYLEMNFCSKNLSNGLTSIPAGFVTFTTSTTSVSEGWTNFGRMNSLFSKGSNEYGDSNTAASHNHYYEYELKELSSDATVKMSIQGNSCGRSASPSHYHKATGYTVRNETIPPYITVPYFQALDDSTLFSDMVVLIYSLNENFDIPLPYDKFGDVNERFMRGGNTYGEIGGYSTHVHVADSILTDSHDNSNWYNYGDCSISASAIGHKHYYSYYLDEQSNIPPFLDLFAIKRRNALVKHTLDDEREVTWSCGGINEFDEGVCNSVGTCRNTDYCYCDSSNTKYYGSVCSEYIDNARYSSQYEINIDYYCPTDYLDQDDLIYKFNCSKIIDNFQDLGEDSRCEWILSKSDSDETEITDNLRIYTDKENVKSVIVKQVSKGEYEDYAELDVVAFGEFNTSGTNVGGLVALIVLLLLGLIVLISVVISVVLILILLYNRFDHQKKRLSKFDKIQDVDLILKEQALEADPNLARIKIDLSKFEINFDDISITDKIGSGGSASIIFKGMWKGTVIAFKCFKTQDVFTSQDDFEQFNKEVSILGSVHHPNILQCFGASMKPPRVGIVMEYCEKGDLKKFAENYKEKNGVKFPLKDKIVILQKIAQAMDYLHGQSIIHRDLKCENILMNEHQEPKVMDFGLSKIVVRMSQTKTQKVGTPLYMAPEVTRGDGYTEKVDIYAYGIIIFAFVTENFDCYGVTDFNVEYKVALDPNFRPKYNSEKEFEGKEWLCAIMEQSWCHFPDDRPSFENIIKLCMKKNEALREMKKKRRQTLTKQMKRLSVRNRKEQQIDDIIKSFQTKIDVLNHSLKKKNDDISDLKLEQQKLIKLLVDNNIDYEI